MSIEAGQQISSPGAGIVDGNNVVLEAGTGIGNADAVEMDADNFAAAGGTGRVNLVDVAGGARVTTLDTIKGGDTISGVSATQDVCLDIVGGDLTIDENINAGTIAALKSTGNIASNATTTAASKVSVESTGGGVSDGNGATNNFVADQVVLKADGNIGSKTDAVDIDSNTVAAQSVSGEVNLNETSGDMNLGDIALEKNGGTINNITAGTDICLTADDGTVNYSGRTIQAGNEIAIRTRDTLVTHGLLTTGTSGRVSVEVTAGDILDPVGDGLDIQTGDAVLKASGKVGERFNPLELDVNRLAAQAQNGEVSVFEKNGLVITDLDLSKAGGTVNGIAATKDVDVIVDNGSLDLGSISGNNVRVNVKNGDITDGNGPTSNINANGDVRLDASGCIGENDDLEITAGGTVSINSKTTRNNVIPNDNTVSTGFVPYSAILDVIPNFVLPPGVFAQDNVDLGESGFYLDELYGYLTPEQFRLIVDRLDLYDYVKDKDFLLEKHPDAAADDRDEKANEEN